jgi:hypothetical protein
MGLKITRKQFVTEMLTVAPLAGFLWGFAEGTAFFIVPDVLISLVALYSFRRFLYCTTMALLGSLTAGFVVYLGAEYFHAMTESVVHSVPFVTQKMFDTVNLEYKQQGVWALFDGPRSGKPYKIYATYAPAYVGILPFLLVSIPVRLSRFILVGLVAWVAGHLSRRFLPVAEAKLPIAHAICWCAFYLFYWTHVS